MFEYSYKYHINITFNQLDFCYSSSMVQNAFHIISNIKIHPNGNIYIFIARSTILKFH